jgi:hypothetical protein
LHFNIVVRSLGFLSFIWNKFLLKRLSFVCFVWEEMRGPKEKEKEK